MEVKVNVNFTGADMESVLNEVITARDGSDSLKERIITSQSKIAKLPSEFVNIDQTAELQAFLDGVQDGETVKLPMKEYNVNRISFTKSNVTITADKGTVIKANTQHVRYDEPFITILGDNITIENITFDGNNLMAWGLVVKSTSTNIEIEKCEIKNVFDNGGSHQAVGLHIEANANYVELNRVSVHDIRGTSNGSIGDSIGATKGIYVGDYDANHVPESIYINRCKVYNITNVGVQEDADGIHTTAVADTLNNSSITIDNCDLYNCAKRFIKIQAEGTIVKNCRFHNTTAGVLTDYTDGMGAAIQLYRSNIIIENNKFWGTGSYYHTIHADNGSTTSKRYNVKIRNNNFSIAECTVKPYQANIYFSGDCKDVVIEGNTCDGGLSALIFSNTANNCVVKNNTFRGLTENGLAFSSFAAIAMENNIIECNYIEALKYAVAAEFGTCTIKNNTLIGGVTYGSIKGANLINVKRSGNVGIGFVSTNIDKYTTLPTLTQKETWQGGLALVTSAGVDDALHVVIKNAAGTYVWKQITLV